MSNSDNSGEAMISVPVPEWPINVTLSDLKSGELPDITAKRGEELPSIFRVPESIRKWDPSAYTPQNVAIGPYHRKSLPENDICKSLEQYKVWSVHSLLSGNSHAETQQLIDSCLSELVSLAPRIRRCYSADDIGLPDDHDLTELTLLDGCFVLIRLLRHLPEKKRPSCKGNTQGPLLGFENVWSGVLEDLVKIENQIPFFVFTTLLGKPPRYGTGNVDVIKLARVLFEGFHPRESKDFKPAKKNDQGEYPYDHLLHFFYSSRLPKDTTTEEAGNSSSTAEGETRSYCSAAVDLISRCLKMPRTVNPSADEEGESSTVDKSDEEGESGTVDKSDEEGESSLADTSDEEDIETKYLKIPSATELHRAGVGFKEKEKANSFLDIEFKKRMFRKGELEIPRLVIWDDTDQLLRNLVAFEQCSERIKVKYMSDYVSFMDCLIDNSKDVDLLESRGILQNHADAQKMIAHLYNKLTKGVCTDDDEDYLADLYTAVKEYHESSWHQYRAKMIQDYFSNPWSCLSLFAAIFLLAMAALQTVYTVIGYYKN